MPKIEERPTAPPVRAAATRKKWGWIKISLIVVVVISFVYSASVVIKKQNRLAAMTEASSNMRSVYYLMVEFDQDFGHFPNDKSAVNGYTGEYSNDYFAQFLHHGYTMSEEVFYAKGGSSVIKKADNVIRPPERALEAGECGLAYVIGNSSASHVDTPIAMAPMGRSGLEFLAEPYSRTAVVLRADGVVKMLQLNGENRALIKGKKTLFQSGKDSVWGENGFDASRLKHAK